MKRVLILIVALWVVCVGVIGGVQVLGHQVIGWPFNFFGMQNLPDKDMISADSGKFDDDVFPPNVGDFSRATFGLPNYSDGRVLYSFTAEYFPPSGDPQSDLVFIAAEQFSDAAVANLLVDPSNLRLQSLTTHVYFALNPLPYKFTATTGDYRSYQIDFVDRRWNVTITCTNYRLLIAFVNQYRH